MTDQVEVTASSDLIHWLLYESEISRYKISKETGISEATLSRIANKDTPIDQVRFGSAHKLTAYAKEVQAKQKGLITHA